MTITRVVPMIQVADVTATSRWYQEVLGMVSGHGGDEFEMLFAGEPFESPLLLQLHGWDAEEHGFRGSPDRPVGNGSSLWFETTDKQAFDRAAAHAVACGATVLDGPGWNPLAHHHALTLQDPNGYVVSLHTPFTTDP